MLVSMVQQSESATRKHICTLFWISFPFRSPKSIVPALHYRSMRFRLKSTHFLQTNQSWKFSFNSVCRSPQTSFPSQMKNHTITQMDFKGWIFFSNKWNITGLRWEAKYVLSMQQLWEHPICFYMSWQTITITTTTSATKGEKFEKVILWTNDQV